MPSDNTTDESTRACLDVLAKVREEFHSALVATEEDVRRLLDGRGATVEARAERTAAELGAFAVGHIDIERFAALQANGKPIPEDEASRLEAAERTLRALVESGEELYVTRVEPGGDLRETVTLALGRAGRAFGAARTVELTRAGHYEAALHAAWLDSFPPSLWSRRERELAPPLVVEVEGGDLRAGGLAEFLDGTQKIVLVVRGEASPAALARLITPGVLVQQTDDPARLGLLAEAEGPAIAALVPAEACRFLHLPATNGERARLTVEHMPEATPRRAIGSVSVFQQTEELRHLAGLADGWAVGAPQAADGELAATPGGTSAGTPADRLAAWILRQADLSGSG